MQFDNIPVAQLPKLINCIVAVRQFLICNPNYSVEEFSETHCIADLPMLLEEHIADSKVCEPEIGAEMKRILEEHGFFDVTF